VHATCSWFTFWRVICVSGENRAPPGSRPYTGQSPGACRLAMSSRVSMDFPRDGVAQALELGLAAKPENALDDASLLVQQHRVGQSPVVINRFHVALSHQNRERRLKLGDECAHLAGVHVVGNCRNIELRAAEALV